MDYPEFLLALQLLAEERYGRAVRQQDRVQTEQVDKFRKALQGTR